MRKSIVSVQVLIFAFLFIALRARAQQASQDDIPHTISYQGMLSHDGIPFNGTQEITVSIYSDAAGTNRIWTQTFEANVANGVFNLSIGSSSDPLPPSPQMDRPYGSEFRSKVMNFNPLHHSPQHLMHLTLPIAP
ncbi:MAG: hypothetical protein ACRDF4_09905 [Rhabdochlamydiaceae bacterium]